jgi:tripartite-type tricarboxylate transporter receptor subunit TctC
MAAAAAAASALGAQAQSAWPAKPVTLVVPFPAGGGTDAFARPLSAQFARLTGKQLVIDNRGGAGGTLGAGIAAKAAPDGYTLFMGAVHHAIAPVDVPQAGLRHRERLCAAGAGGQRAAGAGDQPEEGHGQ